MTKSPHIPEPDQRGSIIYIGEQAHGLWHVRESSGLLEGRFISREAAWRFARSEIHAYPGARIVFTTDWAAPAAVNAQVPGMPAIAHAA